jgi:hypothetical protein
MERKPNSLRWYACILFFVFFLNGSFGQNQFSSIVHVYVPGAWSRDIQVLFNDREICEIKGHMMLAYEIYSVGYLRITVKTSEAFGQSWTTNANVNIKEGDSYYFEISTPVFRWSKFELTQKEKDIGEKEILKIKSKKIIHKYEDKSSPITEPPLN